MGVSIVPALRALKPAAMIVIVASVGLAVGYLGERRVLSGDEPGATDRIQSQDSRRRQRHSLPVLPRAGAAIHLGRRSQRQQVRGLPSGSWRRTGRRSASSWTTGQTGSRSPGSRFTICRTSSISRTSVTCRPASRARPVTGPSRRCSVVSRVAPMKMGWCLDCHKKNEVQNGTRLLDLSQVGLTRISHTVAR